MRPRLTRHAVVRYQQRIAPLMSVAEVRRYLESCDPQDTGAKSRDGGRYVLLGDAVCVVRRDGPKTRPIVVTIVGVCGEEE